MQFGIYSNEVKMVKNKLEGLFSKSLKAASGIWGMKLHNNMLAHQTTPADYIITLERNFKPIIMLVECKQVTCEEGGQGRFAFRRLKQLHDLESFETVFGFHESYLCLGYHERGWNNGSIYIVPIEVFAKLMKTHRAKSLNRKDAELHLKDYKVKMNNGVMDLWQLK